MQCASRQLYNRLGGKPSIYKHTKLLIFTTRPGQYKLYKWGKRGWDHNGKQQIKITQYDNCSLDGGALQRAKKNLRFPDEESSSSLLRQPFPCSTSCLGSKMLVEMLDPHIKQLSCTSNAILFVLLPILIAIQQAWHQGRCTWQALQQAIVAVRGQEVGLPGSLGYQSNAPWWIPSACLVKSLNQFYIPISKKPLFMK